MKHPELPKIPYLLFQWFCKEDLFEELEGDLEESFLENRRLHGLQKARRIYWREVFRMIRPSVLSRPKNGPGYQLALLVSYVNISLRNIKRHKLFSFINIFSLSVAMSSGLLVIGMISDLLKFDEFHQHKDKIYRVISTPYLQEQAQKTKASSPFHLGYELSQQVPNIQVTRLGRHLAGDAVANEKKVFYKGIYAEDNFFDFFSFELLKGDPYNCLRESHTLLISESFANKVFDDTNPIGEFIALEGLGTFSITGIIADAPQFSHIQFDVIASLATVMKLEKEGIFHAAHDDWENINRYFTYIFIPGEQEKDNVDHWLNSVAPGYYTSPEEFNASFELQAINKIVPGPNISDSIGPKMIYLPIIILSIIAGAILLSAIFNYTNLSMARSLRRAREVGIRKLNGASGRSVFMQFSIEAVVLSLLSLGFGLAIFLILRNEFIEILPRAKEMVTLQLTPELLGWFIGFAIATGLIAGVAPSLFFYKIEVIKALRSGSVLRALSGISFRKALIVAQFSLSIIFILSVTITHKQYRYSLNKDLGFDQSNILNIDLQKNDPEILRSELLKLPEVSSVSFSSYTPGIGSWRHSKLVDPRNNDTLWVHQIHTDAYYLNNMKIDLIAGRSFQPNENTSIESTMIVNETFLRNFGINSAAEAIGMTFNVDLNNLQIIGVIKDIIYANLEEPIKSFVIRNKYPYEVACVKLATNDYLEVYNKIENTWDEIDKDNRLNASFYEHQLEDYYTFLVDFMKIFGFIGFLAVSISCLGLFGIAIYSTEIRMKEIGIRKTFGASEQGIIFMLSRGFLKLVSIAIIIGVPICYLLFDRVILAQQVFRTDISIVEIGICVISLMTLCLLTIITQTWRAARKNPSAILRDE